MNVIGIGTDLCDCDRIAAMIERHGDTFLQKVFTPDEIAYCARHRAAAEHFAGRWAAKEAVLKAFGTGWAKGIQWTDLEVCLEDGGRPRLALHGAARDHATRLGIGEVLISISHTAAMANAFAVAVGPGPDAAAQGPDAHACSLQGGLGSDPLLAPRQPGLQL